MGKKDNEKETRERTRNKEREPLLDVHPDTMKSVWVVMLFGVTIIFILAAADQAGPLGEKFYTALETFFGFGYYLFPLTAFCIALSLITTAPQRLLRTTLIASGLLVVSGLGFIDIISPGSGGLTGNFIGALQNPFGIPVSLVITGATLLISFLLMLNKPLRFSLFSRNLKKNVTTEDNYAVSLPPSTTVESSPQVSTTESQPSSVNIKKEDIKIVESSAHAQKPGAQKVIKNYVLPPLSLLASSIEKPTIGDLRGNANIIKRTFESFGIAVEMGEVNVGPTVTRYTLKPAEGVKLSRIVALNQDLALALAAHPIRIEAPIPGKSLVGIEVPNKAAAIVRLGSLLLYPEFQKADSLTFALGRNVNGEPIFADIAKMPHLLIAGATGSGKSIAIHSLIISLLYKNSPDMLRCIFIDPKRVELSVYSGLPHLIAPVVTDNKHAIGALRWALSEMDRRYQLLLEVGSRDIKSYNKSAEEKIPYILIIIDELADLMATYGREVEGAIIRLAQMARATGIHIVVSTQRPSVEVITGLIKANITSRVALQVASQIDSRTILDTAGAEKLLGSGDSLFVSAELSKPRRIQGAYITEDEIKGVARYIVENNPVTELVMPDNDAEAGGLPQSVFEGMNHGDNDDELFHEAVEVVKIAEKASASLLQRRLKVGYARAARLLDLMEEAGIIGPGDGAKPREVFVINAKE